MKFHYTILINGTNMAVQKDIEADNIEQATISAKARVREIWGLTAKLKQKIINREKDFYKDEYYSQNKETGRYKKEFTLMVKALSKTTDSGSRVFDRLFKVLDNKSLRIKYTISYNGYYTAGIKLNNGKYSRSETEKRISEVIATSKQEALQKLKNRLKKAEKAGYRYSDFKIIKIEKEPVFEKLSEKEKLNYLFGDEVKPKKIFNISAHLKGGDLVRKFIAIGANESDVKNKVKRLFLTRGEYDFIISENPTFSMERFNKLAQGKEVIRNELRS